MPCVEVEILGRVQSTELDPTLELISANSGGLSIDSIKIFDEAATLSQNANCRSNPP